MFNTMMDSTNQSVSHPVQLSAQRYNHQLQPGMWSNSKVCQNANGQSANMDPYSQQANHYYQAQYQSQSNDINRYVSPVSKDQNSNSVAYSQYPMQRQTSYSCPVPTQNYQVAAKSSCSSNMYYPNVNVSKNYPPTNIHSPKKYATSSLGLSQAHPTVPQSPQYTRNTGTPMPQMPHYGEHNNYPMQNMYVSNYNMHANTENDQSYMLQQTISSQSPALPVQETLIHSMSTLPANQVSQVSSIPTPPETSSLIGDGLSVLDNASVDAAADSMKMDISNSFVLPGSVLSHIPNNMQSSTPSITNSTVMSNRNSGNSLQPPANLDEGSQASSASASSSIPDEQNSMKTNSKPNFSYPPTPNTLSSPGAASMSSFHDDIECISSPGWPKTPASPVANSNYEFANIKRPENLLKLYTLSDEPDRRYFLDKLIVFNEDRGSPITQCPTISKQPLDVFRVYLTVKERGGFVEVTNSKRWKDIAGAIGVGASSSAAYTLRKQYMKLLLPFECKFDRGGIDPQPIINMVESSSRKKGKNTPAGNYGNQTHYNQGYPQPIDRYHTGYSASYQSSRYPCNNNSIDYQCTSNAMHYPQTAPTNVPHNSASGQNQYNQYSQSPSSNYRYYQGNNSTISTGYNNNMPNNVSDNLCRFGRSATSTPVPQEQGYYTHHYSAPQQGQNIQDIYNSSRGCAMQENLSLPVANQITNELELLTSYSAVNNTIDTPTMKPDSVQLPKSNSECFGNINIDVSLNNSTSDISQDDKVCLKNTYNTANKPVSADSPLVTSASYTPVTNALQSYHQSVPENTAVNKTLDGNYYSDASSVPNRNQATYLNHVQNSYPNQKMPYQGDCQNKEQMQSSQYARYSETQNESYRGSEGPPETQMEKNRNVVPNDGTLSSTSYQYSSTVTKSNTYTYAPPQQGHNKDALNNLVYPHQYNNRPQRAWLSEQNQHSYPHTGQRPQLKPQVNPSEGKQLPEVKSRKSWLSFQNSSQNKNKNQSVSTSIPTQNQTFLSAKTQPQSNVSPASQTSPVVKKPLEFPPNTVESTTPVAVKRRRCPAKRLGQIELWRLLLSLKSGLLAESTYALDCLGILLADNNTVVYFNLDHLPGLLTVLVDHLRCFLNKIFGIAEDMELRKSTTSHSDQLSLGSNDIFNNEGKINILDTPNFTYKTRCRKKIEIQYDEAVFLIDPQRSWDLYEDFDVSAEHWQKGGGDITSHIQTCFAENTKKVKFCRELTNEKAKDINENHTTHDKSNMWKSSLLYKGEPVVVLKKVNFDADKAIATTYTGCDVDADDSCSVKSVSSDNSDKEVNCSDKEEELEKDSDMSNDSSIEILSKDSSKSLSIISDGSNDKSVIEIERVYASQISQNKTENCDPIKENFENFSAVNDASEIVSSVLDKIEDKLEMDDIQCVYESLVSESKSENCHEVNKNVEISKNKDISDMEIECIYESKISNSEAVSCHEITKNVENLELNGDEASICTSSVSEENESEMEIECVFESGILKRKTENSNETTDTCNISESDGDASKNKSSDNKNNFDSEIECIYESRISGSNTGNCIESKECTSSHKANNNTSQTAACISDQEEEKIERKLGCVYESQTSELKFDNCEEIKKLIEAPTSNNGIFTSDRNEDKLEINFENTHSVSENKIKHFIDNIKNVETPKLNKDPSKNDTSDLIEDKMEIEIKPKNKLVDSKNQEISRSNKDLFTNMELNKNVETHMSKEGASQEVSSIAEKSEDKLESKVEPVSKAQTTENETKTCDKIAENVGTFKSNKDVSENISRLRGSLSSRKRFLCEVLEDEAYCFDEPALCVISDSQEMLSRRCVCVSTILRNLSFVPGNDSIMSKNPGILLLLGRLLLLHHEHKPAKNAYHKYEKEVDGNSTWNESCISLKDEHEWWWGTLNVLRDNTLVILSNISSHLDLSPFPEEVSLPILDGLLHWVVCPSSYAQDPLPSRSPSSVLSPQRLCLETLCKLSVLSSNVDLIIATPPWSRIEDLLAFLTKCLSHGHDQIMREFAVVLLSNISQTDIVAARTIADQSCCISYLIAFIEEAEANAFQIASSQGTKKLRDKPELMGTTPGMVQRAANTLKNLALVPENRVLFMRYQSQLLSLAMSQVMDQELSTIIADVLFYCFEDEMGESFSHLPVS